MLLLETSIYLDLTVIEIMMDMIYLCFYALTKFYPGERIFVSYRPVQQSFENVLIMVTLNHNSKKKS